MNTLKLSKYKTNNHPSPNQELYHRIFRVGKPWPSGLERRLKKYGWFSSGLNKLVSIPFLNLHFLQGRRYKALSQPSTSELNHPSIHGRRSRALAHALPTLNGRWYSSSQKPAFTIIEVVLVLAIAGLIFLMVFIALPALQRNQRDTQRKDDAGKLKNAIDRYKANNKGRMPYDGLYLMQNSSTNDFARAYLNANEGEFRSPEGQNYTLIFNSAAIVDSTRWRYGGGYDYNVNITQNKKCDGEYVVPATGNNRYAIYMKLEAGGFYCIDG